MTAQKNPSHPPPSAPAPPEEDPYIGRRFGDRYEILSKIGEGSQARVYLARHIMIDRPVAVKFLLPVLATDRSLVGRFLNEGRAAGSLGHPNIVESLDLGFAPDGAPYLVLELLEGRTLADEIVAAGPLDPARAAYIGAQIASAVSAAHARGIVHRDLKPANVLLIERNGRRDHVKVLDFGISKFTATGSRVTTITGQPLGTPGFMAPEQIEDPQNTDIRADVYGLGATLYDMLCGVPPFAEFGFPKVLRLIVEEEPRRITEIRQGLPRGLVDIVEQAMKKLPADRFQTMEEFEHELHAFAEEPSRRGLESRRGGPRPMHAAPASVPPPAPPPRPAASRAPEPPEQPKRRRKLALVALLAGSALALVLLLVALRRGETEAPAGPKPDVTVARQPIAPAPRGESPPATTGSPQEPEAVPAPVAGKPSSTARVHERGAVHVALKPGAHPEAAPATAPVNCSPPFYYEGKKKLFKAGCI
jgi:serine/threonine-protein kinase